MEGLTTFWRIHKQLKWVYLILPSLLKTEYQLICSPMKMCKQGLLFLDCLPSFQPSLANPFSPLFVNSLKDSLL